VSITDPPADCPLCRKVAHVGELQDELVWQFPHSVALLGPWQFYTGYCLLVSRRHATELSRLDDAERSAFLAEMCLLARAVEDSFRPSKLNYELLGNQVPHLHWHLFPRYQHDPEALKPVWLALDRADRDEAEKRRLTAGTLDRTTTVTRLRQRLEALSAPLAAGVPACGVAAHHSP
jgi:diadenosine tetraphosphate (Ap4A) HIT family hydrolase